MSRVCARRVCARHVCARRGVFDFGTESCSYNRLQEKRSAAGVSSCRDSTVCSLTSIFLSVDCY